MLSMSQFLCFNELIGSYRLDIPSVPYFLRSDEVIFFDAMSSVPYFWRFKELKRSYPSMACYPYFIFCFDEIKG